MAEPDLAAMIAAVRWNIEYWEAPSFREERHLLNLVGLRATLALLEALADRQFVEQEIVKAARRRIDLKDNWMGVADAVVAALMARAARAAAA